MLAKQYPAMTISIQPRVEIPNQIFQYFFLIDHQCFLVHIINAHLVGILKENTIISL